MSARLKQLFRSDWIVLLPASLTIILLHALTIQKFGIFRDELYYIACSNHPAAGYVDQPPLSLWFLRIIRMILGDSVAAIRFLPVLAGGVWVFCTGLLAREFGGKKRAMFLASLASMAVLGNMVLFHFYSMNFWDMLFWQVLFFVLIRIVKTGNEQLWITFGYIAGIGLLNKISILFLGFGLFAGLVLTEHRHYLKSGPLWAGAALAGLFFLPYVLWNAAHDWPMIEFIHNAKTYKMAAVSPAGFFMGQLLYNNPVNGLIWIPGLIFLIFSKQTRPFRVFGWIFLTIYILFTVQQAKDYYLAAAYPVLFAGGAVFWETVPRKRTGRLLISALSLLIAGSLFIFTPVTLPVLSASETGAYIQKLGIGGNSGENHEIGVLPQHFADRHGWEEMTKTFAGVYSQLSPREQAGCLIYVRNYGEAGAIDYFGPKYGLPEASCSHNNYWIWGPEAWDGKVAIIYGWSHDIDANFEDLNRRFQYVEHAATFTHPYVMPYQNNRHIFLCRDANFSFEEIWAEEKNFN
ncbi:glycosyltransferase family 39 protein [bacterium]|nr:glycosyltransferase family 39 protein [bacterium]